ncbi:hypothetical protein PI23P_02387 [Polaribacter irgensii 23-P]|uniref:J domain-containing protein n=1 Tax=Polaribacter irgensii 23-P TaxID=313594 RepID=A4BWG4_9FLAO|nr:GvpL/GvpF family gas vesicle protein [Polaribacter irgensii]EAR13305.1 hypothetical protein PI23P_02387 [Polaribacter irgensii 23-P]
MEKGIIDKSLYIYGFVPNDYDDEQLKQLENIGVTTISFQKISAIVSQKEMVTISELNTETLAKLMIHHQNTIERLMNIRFNSIIPMRLGTFCHDSLELIGILEKEYDLIRETTEKVHNLVEIEVISTWANFSQIMSEIAVNPEIVEMKEKSLNNENGITQADQLNLGYLVKTMLDGLQSGYATKITETFSALYESTKQHELMDDQMVSNTAFLIHRSKLGLFEKALDVLDESLNGKLNFKFVGPLPCYSFYTMELTRLSIEKIESAKKELGLDDFTSENSMQQAYLDKAKLLHPDANTGEDATIVFNQIKKAHKTLQDFADVLKPASKEEPFSLQRDVVIKNALFLKIKE